MEKVKKIRIPDFAGMTKKTLCDYNEEIPAIDGIQFTCFTFQ